VPPSPALAVAGRSARTRDRALRSYAASKNIVAGSLTARQAKIDTVVERIKGYLDRGQLAGGLGPRDVEIANIMPAAALGAACKSRGQGLNAGER
jgi:hypothetical protein